MRYTNSELANLKNKIITIDNNRDIEVINMICDFTEAHNDYKIGDIVRDHLGSIKIESMLPLRMKNIHDMYQPQMVYTGKELKANLKPRKDNSCRDLYQENILESQ